MKNKEICFHLRKASSAVKEHYQENDETWCDVAADRIEAMEVNHIKTLKKSIDEVFENNQSLCLDNADERAFLKGLIMGTFFRLTEESEVENENT